MVLLLGQLYKLRIYYYFIGHFRDFIDVLPIHS